MHVLRTQVGPGHVDSDVCGGVSERRGRSGDIEMRFRGCVRDEHVAADRLSVHVGGDMHHDARFGEVAEMHGDLIAVGADRGHDVSRCDTAECEHADRADKQRSGDDEQDVSRRGTLTVRPLVSAERSLLRDSLSERGRSG